MSDENGVDMWDVCLSTIVLCMTLHEKRYSEYTHFFEHSINMDLRYIYLYAYAYTIRAFANVYYSTTVGLSEVCIIEPCAVILQSWYCIRCMQTSTSMSYPFLFSSIVGTWYSIVFKFCTLSLTLDG